jgi:hypothetical protein
MTSKILEDSAYAEIFLDIARESEDIDFELLREITDMEESKMELGRRHGVFQELRRIINRYLDSKGR